MEMFTFRGLHVNHLEEEEPVAWSLIGIKEDEVLCIVRCCLPQAVGIQVLCQLSSPGFEQGIWLLFVAHLVSAAKNILRALNQQFGY